MLSSLINPLSASVRLVVLAGVLALAGCDSAEERLAKYLESGEQLLEEGVLDKAALEFRNALELQGNSVPAHLGMATIYERQQNYAGAMSHLNRVIEIDPVNVSALVKLAQYMTLAGQIDEAYANASAAVEAAPNNVDALAMKAGLSLKLGNTTAALELARKVLAIAPGNATAAAVLIGERTEAGDVEAALALNEEALEITPDDLGLALMKVRLLEDLDRQKELGEWLATIADRFPEQETLRIALVRWHVNRDDLDSAEAELRKLAAAHPDDPEKSLDVARFLMTSKGIDAARGEIGNLIANATDKTPYRIALAQLELEEGEAEKGAALLEEVIADSAGADDQQAANRARLILADIMLKNDDEQRARTLISDVLAVDGENPSALGLRAAMAFEDANYDAAILDLRTALGAEPNNPRLLRLSARAHMRNGSIDLAGERFAAAMVADGYSTRSVMEYVRFLKLANRQSSVLPVLNEAIRRQPGSAELLNELAEAQVRVQDWTALDQTAAQLSSIDEAASQRVRVMALAGRARYDESLAILENLSRDPKQRDSTLTATVQLHIRANQPERAEKFLDQLLADDPSNDLAMILRAALYERVGDVRTAEDFYRRAVQTAPKKVEPHLGLAQFMLRQQRIDDAIQAANEGLEEIETNGGLRLFLGGIYERQQKFDEAIAQYEKLHELNPRSAVAANNLASLLAEHRSDDPAEVERAARIAEPLRGLQVPALQDTYGWILYLKGDHEGALRALAPAAEGLPDNPYVRYHAAKAYAALGDVEEARGHFEAAIAAGPQAFAHYAKAKDELSALPQPETTPQQ